MTIQSFSGLVDTKGEFKTVNSVTELTLAENNIYTIQSTKPCYIKVGDAVFFLQFGQPFQFKQGSDALYIKTNYGATALSVLENETEGN